MENQRMNYRPGSAVCLMAGKALKFLMRLVFCFIIFETGIIIFNGTPTKWYAHCNCLCGRAYFHATEKFAPDTMLFNEIGYHELLDDQILIFSIHCRRHDNKIWITIYGNGAYSVQGTHE